MARSLTPTDLLLVFAPLRLGEQVQGSDEDHIRDFEGARKEAPHEGGPDPEPLGQDVGPAHFALQPLQHRSPHTRAGHGGNDCPGGCEISAIRANLMRNTGNAVAAQ